MNERVGVPYIINMYINGGVNLYDLSAAQYKAESRQNQCTLTAVKLSFIIEEKKKRTQSCQCGHS